MFGEGELDAEGFFFFAPVDGEDTVWGEFLDRLLELEVIFIGTGFGFLWIFSLGGEDGMFLEDWS